MIRPRPLPPFHLAVLAILVLPCPGRLAVAGDIEPMDDGPDDRAPPSATLRRTIEGLRRAAAAEPASPVHLVHLGRALRRAGDLPGARRALEEALRLAPDLAGARLDLGDILFRLGDLDESLGEYRRGLVLAPGDARANELTGRGLIRLDRAAEAEPLIQRALELAPTAARKSLAERLRSELAGPGWERTFEADTEHYRVSTPVSPEVARDIGARAERIRREYEEVLGSPRPPGDGRPRKTAILVYRDLGAYGRGGSPDLAMGHFDPLFRKLSIPLQASRERTLWVLHHEAFHAFLHESTVSVPPWFGEGLADHFGGFSAVGDGPAERLVAGPNGIRLTSWRAVLSGGAAPSSAALMQMSHRELYRPFGIIGHYAQAWVIAHFLLEGGREEYRKALEAYWASVRGGAGREAAFAAAFGAIDMDRFDRELREFTAGLRPGP